MVAANMTNLVAHDGPFFDHWRRRAVASYGAIIPDEAKAS